MGKYYGKIGYTVPAMTAPGVWRDDDDMVVTRNYYGDILQCQTRWQGSENLNDNLVVSHRLSIVADPYAYENFSRIKYAEWMGVQWKVMNIEVQRPRLILTLGGEYNGQ